MARKICLTAAPPRKEMDMRELIDFIKGSLSSDGKESFARTGCMIIIYFLLLWASYIVSKTATIPDVPLQWMALVSMLYLGGKYLDKKGEANVGNTDATMGQP